MNCVTWNLAWCDPHSPKAAEVKTRISALNPSVICITESAGAYFPLDNTILSDADYGYAVVNNRHKVAIWSRDGWDNADAIGCHDLPPGRFIYGESNEIGIIGVCIPWFDAHVSRGRKDRERWEEHRIFLKALRSVITERQPQIIMGDFNQRVPYDPKYGCPKDAFDALNETLEGYRICTASVHPRLIDHIAVLEGLAVGTPTLIDPEWSGGALSDHYGVGVSISL